jgi:hypothetical protein
VDRKIPGRNFAPPALFLVARRGRSSETTRSSGRGLPCVPK